MKLIQTLLCTLVFFYAASSIAQNTNDEKTSSFLTVAPRVGTIVHNGFGVEAGLSVISLSPDAFPWYASSLYASYFIQQKDFDSRLSLDGFKVGVQGSWGIFMVGIEVNTGNYNQKMFTYVSPKVGLSLLDVVNIEYLINVAGKNDNFPWNSNHQIGINASLNRKIYHTVWKK